VCVCGVQARACACVHVGGEALV